MKLLVLSLLAAAAAADTGASSSDPCFAGDDNTFHVIYDPYASETGYWKFTECGDTPMPVLALERGQTYTFDQGDASNWFHPMGFARDADGDDELESDTDYYENGVSIGEDNYEDAFAAEREDWLDASGIESEDEDEGEDEGEDEAEAGDEGEEADEAEDEAEESDENEDETEAGDEAEDSDSDSDSDADSDAGDENEDEQEESDENEDEQEESDENEDEQEDEGDEDEADEDEGDEDEGDEDEDRRRLQSSTGYSVTLHVDDDEDGDLFYYCHIHNFMAGRIKVYDDGEAVKSEDSPAIGYDYDVPSDYDASCGTYGIGDYQRGSGMCDDDAFICTEGDETETQQTFGECMYALDCHMNYNMKSTLANEDPIVTFIHQMIPHHQNAVNMAKAMLKTDTLDSGDGDDRDMIDLMWTIINEQNLQIHQMQEYLEEKGYAESALCSDAGAVDDCSDSAEWAKSGDPSKDCAWVSELPSTRCSVKDADKIFAFEECRASCGSCGACEDSDSWVKAGDDDSKDCVWVSRFINRCAAMGADGTLGYESCRFACGTCSPE